MTLIDFNTARKQGELAKTGLDAADIRDRLHADPRGFIDWLYSGRAYYSRNQARIGNVQGEQGSSLSIDLTTGLWKDHATDEGGDLISLYRAWRGYSGDANFVLSLKEIAHDYLRDPVEAFDRPAWQPTPTARIEQQKAKLGDKPRQENIDLGAPVARYEYYDLHGKIQASVVRFEPDGTRESKTFRPWCFKTVDGQQKWVMGAPDMRPLYRLPELATSPTVVLCEGEGCADALASVGIVATSAMQGAKAPIEKTDWSPLAGKHVIIWPDNDPPGFEYAKAVSAKLVALGCTITGITPPASARAKWDAADCVAEGADAHALIASAMPVQISVQPKPRVRLVTISQLAAMKPSEFLIDGILTENGLSMDWGRSGSLKSFVAIDQSLCVATGMDWHGRKVRKGRVVYLAAEGARGVGQRALGWMRSRGRDLPEPDFHIIPHGLTLVNPADLDALLEALEPLRPLALIVIDTLSRTFGGGNPNAPADMNAFVAACDRLREATGSHVKVIHHGGKDTDKNELGNEGLRNAADTVIHIRRKTDCIELINEAPKGKQKDYEEFKTIKLRPVKTAYEQNDGTEASTLILSIIDDEPEPAAGANQMEIAAAKPSGKWQIAIMRALADAGEPLGATRLSAMTGAQKNTLHNALETLCEKKLIQKGRSDDDKHDVWKLL